MSISIQFIKDEFLNAVDNFRDGFGEFDFLTKSGLTAGDIDGIEGFKSIALEDSTIIEFDEFKSKIIRSLYSNDSDLKKSDFDWDELNVLYEDMIDKYKSYTEVKEQVQDNLTGNQELDLIELHDQVDINAVLLKLALDLNLVYQIDVLGETQYLLSHKLETIIEEN